MPGAKPHILVVDVIRFACALLVVAYHLAAAPFAADGVAGIASSARDWAWWSWSGWVGVEIFFVISGYVIAMSALHGTGRAFLRRRVLRLAPAAWVSATMTGVVLAAAGVMPTGTIAGRWLASISFWPLATQIDASYWTLGIEVCFYLLIATQLTAHRDNCCTIERSALILACVSAAYWAVQIATGNTEPSSRIADLMLLSYGGLFAVGMALWAIRHAGWSPVRLATLAIGLGTAVVEIARQARYMAHGLGIDASPAVPLALFAVAVAGIAGADRLQRPLVRLAAARALGFVGLMTYPLYLLHQQIGDALIAAMRAAGVGDHAALLMAAAAVIVLAAITARAIEPVVRAWLDRALPRPNTVSAMRDRQPAAEAAESG